MSYFPENPQIIFYSSNNVFDYTPHNTRLCMITQSWTTYFWAHTAHWLGATHPPSLYPPISATLIKFQLLE